MSYQIMLFCSKIAACRIADQPPGSAWARACMQAPQLWIVAPRCDPQGEEAYRLACGGADVVLRQVCALLVAQKAVAHA